MQNRLCLFVLMLCLCVRPSGFVHLFLLIRESRALAQLYVHSGLESQNDVTDVNAQFD